MTRRWTTEVTQGWDITFDKVDRRVYIMLDDEEDISHDREWWPAQLTFTFRDKSLSVAAWKDEEVFLFDKTYDEIVTRMTEEC